MSTTIRPELSDKNQYWIEKHRYYELKHFCLQYPIWKKAHSSIDGMVKKTNNLEKFNDAFQINDITGKCAEAKYHYSNLMDMVNRTASDTDPYLGSYILKAVTEGLSYESLRVRTDIPCCRDTYYNLYRRFFWLLNKARN
ncbi:MAG: hypothetical protein K9L62_01940 [Vallitaleaceae bacterium]|nr:hypothetical protein [Vallitaleaceae bacterium]